MGSQPDPPGFQGGFVSAKAWGGGCGVAQSTPGDLPGRSGVLFYFIFFSWLLWPALFNLIIKHPWSEGRAVLGQPSHFSLCSTLLLQLEARIPWRGLRRDPPPIPPQSPQSLPVPIADWRAQKAAAQRGDAGTRGLRGSHSASLINEPLPTPLLQK